MTTTTTPISQVFERLKSQQQLAFIPFVTAGDPDLAGTNELIELLAEEGADLIEVGFPYSDPIADGPVIQESYTRALQQKLTVDQIFESIGKLDHANLPPLLAMVSYAIIFRHGMQRFLDQAKAAGFSGFIVPDLPTDEAGELAPLMKTAALDLIPLVAPTTTERRATEIVSHSTGFVYCIAVAGITGARDSVSVDLTEQLTWLKTQTDTPLAVGFGISKPEHLDPLRSIADGAIVGSAIVRYLADVADGSKDFATVKGEIREFAGKMIAAAHQSAGK